MSKIKRPKWIDIWKAAMVFVHKVSDENLTGEQKRRKAAKMLYEAFEWGDDLLALMPIFPPGMQPIVQLLVDNPQTDSAELELAELIIEFAYQAIFKAFSFAGQPIKVIAGRIERWQAKLVQ